MGSFYMLAELWEILYNFYTKLFLRKINMKIERNNLCPCGSGKKYKYCCLNSTNVNQAPCIKYKSNIEGICKNIENRTLLSKIFLELYKFIDKYNFRGACHEISSIMYVLLSETGFSPKICLGEIEFDDYRSFDHSWIELNDKIVDIAIAYPHTSFISNPILLNMDIYSKTLTTLKYGITKNGIDFMSKLILKTNLMDYMDKSPNFKGSSWFVVQLISDCLNLGINTQEIKKKYQNTKWKFIKKSF